MNAPGQREPASFSAEELADPSIDPTTLRQIAAARPDLWRLVHDHPNCDRELAGFIEQNTPPAAPPQQPPGAPQPGGQPPQAAQQMATGARQVADGAKTYFTNTVAPAARSATRTVSEKSGLSSGSVHWTTWFQFALPAVALIGIIALFMPLASVSAMGRTETINYFSEDAPSGEGVAMLTLFLLVIGFAVVSLLTAKKWAVITTGVIAILAGLFSMLNGFGTSAAINDLGFGSVGAGAILLGIVGTAMLVTAIITMLPKPKPGPQQPYGPQQPPHPHQQQMRPQYPAPHQQAPLQQQMPPQQGPPQQGPPQH
ncbi:variant leucine-rich repeat-containing protein [Nocardiopsis nanhaiensis]